MGKTQLQEGDEGTDGSPETAVGGFGAWALLLICACH